MALPRFIRKRVSQAQAKSGCRAGLIQNPVRKVRQFQAGNSGGTSLLDVGHLPPQLATLVRQSYGDATGRIFLIAAVCSLISLIAVLFIKEVPLRRTVAKLDDAPSEQAQSAEATTSPLS